jgi:PKD repeat protein
MRITRQQLNKLLEGIATAHYQIHTYGWGDVPDLLAREDIIYPFMMVTPQASVYGDNTINHTYTISIADRVLKDKENEVAVDSDTHEILMHVVTQLDNLLYDDVDLIKGVSVTPFFDNFRHEVTGHFANVTVQVMYNYDACAVPSDNVPLPIPPPSDCADATYIVRFEDGTPIETGTIPSGGTKTIEVPNCPPSGTVEWELRDTDGVLIDSGSQNAGDPLTIVAPDGAVTITDSDGATLYVVNVTSGGAETQAIGDSSVEVRNSLNAVVDSGVVKAQGSGVFNAPDATVTVNGDVSFGTIPSDGSKNILVENTDGAPVGAFDGNSNSWVVADSTVNVRKSDATLIQAVTVAAEDTESVNIADSVAVLKDTAANVISSTNIKATETADVIAPDGSLQNSDASATLTVRSGEVNKAISDINIEVNTVVEGTIPALKDVKILITDGTNPVTPDDVSVVGDTVTVEVPSGGAVMNVDFSADKVVAGQGETITFTDLTDNTPTDWGWHFGSEGSSLLQNPTFKFREIGLKNVKLFAANATSGGFDLKSNYIEIKALLDIYTTAAAAYSLRKLRTAYTGSAIRVRRASDNTEQDIGFTSEGFLNTSALVSFVGFSDGFVTTWYDQSGNSRNMTQSTGLAQAKIVTNGTVIRDASEPALEYNDSFYSNSHQFTQNNNLLFLTVLRVNSQRDANPRYCAINSAANSVNIQFGYNADSKYYTRKSAVTNTTTSAFTPIGDRKLLTHGVSGGTSYFSHNGALQTFTGTGAPTADSTIGDGMFLLKGFSDTTFHVLTGKIQEVIIYDNDKLTERAGIETNINDYYNVF